MYPCMFAINAQLCWIGVDKYLAYIYKIHVYDVYGTYYKSGM